MEDRTTIKLSQISALLKIFSAKAYSSKFNEAEDEKIINICVQLWELDYKCEIIENKNGSLCSTYPSRIVVPVYEVDVRSEDAASTPLSDSVLIEVSAPKPDKKDRDKKDDIVKSFKNGGSNHSSKQLKKLNESDSVLNHKSEDEEYLLDKDLSYDDSCKENCTKENAAPPSFSAVVAKSSNKKENGEATQSTSGSKPSSSFQKFTLREYFSKANLARCRYRFPIPSLLCKGKYVSRSATLSCLLDVIGKQILHSSEFDFLHDPEDDFTSMPRRSNELDRARFYDIRLLEAIGTSSILDLMVENKKVKYKIHVSSSEKADKENRYSNFSITSIPYPGCEFFREFTNRKFNSTKLFYDWDQQFNDASLSLAEDFIPTKVTNDWVNYKEWDLRQMTVNYLKLVLKYIMDEDSKETGFLIHCISGWDRTPLFISLVRLSLWADGLVHCSLDAKQMLFFTLAYDWYLFGHQLPDRLKSKENILYFCFEFLEEIYQDSFMDCPPEKRERHPSNSSCTSGAYDSATGGVETPTSSFGSTTSLASSPPSSANPPPPSGLLRVSPPTPKPPSAPPPETCLWPFNKENGFTFDGISDNEYSRGGLAPPSGGEGGEAGVGVPAGVLGKRSSPSRSPLKERNKGSSTPSPAGGVKVGGGGRKGGNLNGFLRDFPGRRSRKSSSTTSGSSAASGAGTEALEMHSYEHLSGGGGGSDSDPPCGVLTTSLRHDGGSTPVPVPPGGRSRHNSASSSVGSWQFLSTSDPLKDSFSVSGESYRSSRTSLTADMIDSTLTIKEEATPSSSLESSQSIIVFNRKRRLSEVREMFFKVYSQEVSSLYPEWSFLTDIVQNIYQKLGN